MPHASHQRSNVCSIQFCSAVLHSCSIQIKRTTLEASIRCIHVPPIPIYATDELKTLLSPLRKFRVAHRCVIRIYRKRASCHIHATSYKIQYTLIWIRGSAGASNAKGWRGDSRWCVKVYGSMKASLVQPCKGRHEVWKNLYEQKSAVGCVLKVWLRMLSCKVRWIIKSWVTLL